MRRGARILFAALVVATVAAFFVAQRLKSEPPAIQAVHFSSQLSPNGDGTHDEVRFRFHIKRSTRVTVQVVDADGATVATLLGDRPVRAYHQVLLPWAGRADSPGAERRVVPDGRYYLKVTLLREGRSFVYPRAVRVDTTPPRPRTIETRAIGSGGTNGSRPPRPPRPSHGAGGGPAIISTHGGGVRAELRLGLWEPTARVVRTFPGPPAVVRRLRVAVTRRADGGSRSGTPPETRALRGVTTWDGRTDTGARAPSGTYVIQVCGRDLAGNVGCGPIAGGPRRLPAPGPSGRLRGHGGVVVRDLAVQTASAPTTPGRPLTFFVDARRRRYRWSLRRVGGPSRPVVSGAGTSPVLRVRVRSHRSAVYRLAVKTGGSRVEVPAIVTSGHPRTVLVVLPAITWQGRNPVDDDGDGLVDTLGSGSGASVRPARVLSGLPAGFTSAVAPVLRELARTHRRFDLTTDLTLAEANASYGGSGAPPGTRISGHRGVLLVGEHRWTTAGVADALRGVVRAGGTVGILDPASLHRTVAVRRSGTLADPTPFAPANALGIVSRGPTALDGPPQTDQDDLDLFAGTDGRLSGYREGWPIERLERGRRVAGAVDRRGRVIVAGVRQGRGLVLRTGLPSLPSRLATDPDSAALLRNVWRRLSR